MARIYFSSWGNLRGFKVPAYAMKREGETDLDCVARALCRSTKSARAILRHDTGNHYEVTLCDKPLPARMGGGSPVAGTLWIAIHRH